MSDLNRVLEESRPAIEAALVDAERELARLEQRRRDLEALIARARAALGEAPVPASPRVPPQRLTLHDAMKLILDESGNRPMTVGELAEEINRRGLYEKRDRTPVDPSQIHARANKYRGKLFDKEGPRVWLVH